MRVHLLLVSFSSLAVAAPAHELSTPITSASTKPGDIYVCSEDGFKGDCAYVHAADNKCIKVPETFNNSKSVAQYKGSACIYYDMDDCSTSVTPVLRLDTRRSTRSKDKISKGIGSVRCTTPLKSRDTSKDEASAISAVLDQLNPPIRAPPSPGDILICDQHVLEGTCDVAHAGTNNECTTFPIRVKRHNKSMVQFRGVICSYWFWDNCPGDQAAWNVDSTNGLQNFPTMANREWLLGSVKCWTPDRKARTKMSRSMLDTTVSTAVNNVAPVTVKRPSDAQHNFVIICPEPNFKGGCGTLPFDKVVSNIPEGIVQSILQDEGAICSYYTDPNCNGIGLKGNHFDIETCGKGHRKAVVDLGQWPVRCIRCNAPFCAIPNKDRRSVKSVESTKESLNNFIFLCSGPNFTGACDAHTFGNDVGNIVEGAISSILQDEGAICSYYRDPNYGGRHFDIITCGKGTKGAVVDLGRWPVRSMRCNTQFCEVGKREQHFVDYGAHNILEVANSKELDLEKTLLAIPRVDSGQIPGPGTLYVCSEKNYYMCAFTDVPLSGCRTFTPKGALSSFVQWQGAVCKWFRGPGCAEDSGDRNPLIVDSRPKHIGIRDLGKDDNKLESVSCRGEPW